MCSHREIDGRHNLVAHFYNRNRNARMMQVFRHFKSDEARSHYNRAFYLFVCDISLDLVGIFHIAKRKDAFRIDAFQRRFYRIGSRRKQKFVISFFIFLSVGFADSQCLLFRVDGDRFILYPYINPETLAERCGSLNQQFLTLGNNATDIIRQSAIGIRNVFAFLQ